MEPILFLSATVITGEEHVAPFVADVLVDDGLVVQIGDPGTIESTTARCIDGKGQYLSPGFIDMHAHSDLYLITNPVHEAKISQGCTTEVVGQDGISYAPVRTKEQLRAIRSQIAGWNGNPSDEECAAKHQGTNIFEWRTVGDYLDCLERNKTATNVAMLVPQGNLRLLACGPNDTPASPAEIQDQVTLLREALGQGAIGMSSGLTYTPGMYASTSELAILCKVLADEYPGAFYAPHHRSYGFKALESYEEMIGLGKNTGCPIHLTHATMNFSENKGRAPELLRMVDGALGAGVDVTLDTYPYLPGCTTLAALLPSWASAGGPDETLRRLGDAETREKIRVAVEVTGCDGGHGIPTNWDEIQIGSTQHEALDGYAGRRVAEVARSVGKPAIEVFYDILVKDRLATSCLMHIGHEENVRAIMQHEKHMSGSDAILHGETLHPRAYGTFTRYLGHYARDLGMFTIPQMMAHLTSRPAKRLNVYPFRGHLGVGSAADLVLFDPETIKDMATFEQPKLTSKGINFVLVNGVVAVDGGRLTGARGGHVLRRRKDGSVASGLV
ncbi:D-aminoacylase [Cordyceps fumosorosea ARSEF 2679]|uniref:D-aminoacylase n=1 Tax=Cordyceps fumosorosea (strain ARSEF 2679) TaxID=1081104 RepID=A0A167LE74_CORFA|nr:D-aminoacylase [Cordyceps fumosorosea ARSEF 2679]OAA52982.1 D-aminoacylase [Cordyceps fumosorosea ARSEF 2679]